MGTTNTIPHRQLAILVAVTETRVIGGSPAVVVSVVGEIDQLTASLWQDVLSRVVSREPRRLVIDLSGVLFLSAAGLSVLINVRNAAAQQGIVVQLKAPHRRIVARALEITGLDRLFEIAPPVTAKDKTLGAPGSGEGDRAGAGSLISSRSAAETEQDEYAHLLPLQRR